MTIAAHMSVRTRLDACLVVAEDGTILFDEFSQTALIAQPIVLGKVLLLLSYAYMISLGVLKWTSREMTKEDFIKEAKKTRDRNLWEPVPLTRILYMLARALLYAICLGTIGEFAGPVGVMVVWALA